MILYLYLFDCSVEKGLTQQLCVFVMVVAQHIQISPLHQKKCTLNQRTTSHDSLATPRPEHLACRWSSWCVAFVCWYVSEEFPPLIWSRRRRCSRCDWISVETTSSCWQTWAFSWRRSLWSHCDQPWHEILAAVAVLAWFWWDVRWSFLSCATASIPWCF